MPGGSAAVANGLGACLGACAGLDLPTYRAAYLHLPGPPHSPSARVYHYLPATPTRAYLPTCSTLPPTTTIYACSRRRAKQNATTYSPACHLSTPHLPHTRTTAAPHLPTMRTLRCAPHSTASAAHDHLRTPSSAAACRRAHHSCTAARHISTYHTRSTAPPPLPGLCLLPAADATDVSSFMSLAPARHRSTACPLLAPPRCAGHTSPTATPPTTHHTALPRTCLRAHACEWRVRGMGGRHCTLPCLPHTHAHCPPPASPADSVGSPIQLKAVSRGRHLIQSTSCLHILARSLTPRCHVVAR